MRRIIILVLQVMFLAVPVIALAAPASVRDLAGRIAQVEVLRGQFEQSKQVAGFRKPLQSQGRFVLARARGILWINERPFASRLALTESQLRAEADGQVKTIDAEVQPGIALIHGLLFDLLGGRFEDLARDFVTDVSLSGNERWRVRLTPRSGVYAEVFAMIELEGGKHVDQVMLDERNGDRTEIQFRDLVEAAQLDADEAQALAN